MKILVSGANGFIGKNLIWGLRNQNYQDIYEFNKNTKPELLDKYCQDCDFVFHLAGVNRPKEQDEYMEGNFEFTSILLDKLKKHNNKAAVIFSSSIQAELDNPYGKSKKAAEELVLAYGKETGAKVLIYRFTNVFGKWCRPNYNSDVATFCHNIARDIPVTVNDSGLAMNLIYIDDVVEEMTQVLKGSGNTTGAFGKVPIVYTMTLGQIVELIHTFKASRNERSIPDMSNGFTRKLYATYLSYLPEDGFAYPLKMNTDNRGSFTEFIRTGNRGQVSVNIIKPHITKGDHWHHTKNEKFLVVSGKGKIRLRKIDSDKVIEYHVSGEKLEAVDIPPGYTHNIENTGDIDMVTVMWANELFNPDRPDTYYLKV